MVDVEPPPEPAVTPDAELRRLDVFLGKWKTAGKTRAIATGRALDVVALDTYEWLPGGFFMVHRFDARLGDEQVWGFELISYDASTETFPMRSFDSQGNASTMLATVRDDVWTFTGETTRSTLEVSDAGDTMTAHWERTTDGSHWMPWMDVTLTKTPDGA